MPSSRRRAARTHPMPTAITGATTPFTPPGTGSRGSASRFSAGCGSMFLPPMWVTGVPVRQTRSLRGAMEYSTAEMMAIAAARALKNEDVCFVGIGAPSVACNLARLTHAPDITLIYESGTIGTKPDVLLLSIGDPELSETALTTVSVTEMFRYWLQGGRFTVGFIGGAQIDRFANLNTTVIGPYDKPRTRLPGGGGAPEIGTCCGEIFIIMTQTKRNFVASLDFITSMGHGEGGEHRARLGLQTKG